MRYRRGLLFSSRGHTLTLRRVALAIVSCIIAGGLFLLTSQAPAPVDAAFGQALSDFSVSSPADPPANFS